MAVLIHFIFSLVKIAIQASIYATIVVLFVTLIAQKKVNQKKRIWFVCGAVISFGLFLFMFSHWGDHGLGDSARIPLAHGREVNQADGSWTYITPEGYEYEVLSIKQFSFNQEYLVGQVEEPQIAKYAIWDLANNKVEFTNALETKYSLNLNFQDFYKHYQEYWGGWRFWLLA